MDMSFVLWIQAAAPATSAIKDRWLPMGYPPMYLIGIPIVCLAILAFCRKDSLWGTLIKIFNVFFASMITMNYYAPLANVLDGIMVASLYYNDMYAFFLLFGLTLFILVEITNRISMVNVKFEPKTNLIGTLSLLLVLFVGFYFSTGFMFMTLLPEAPRLEVTSENVDKYPSPPTFKLVEYLSKTTFKPFGSKPHVFSYKAFLDSQNRRNTGVYIAAETGSWKFDGQSSPNIKSNSN